jgi:hypothetical protein
LFFPSIHFLPRKKITCTRSERNNMIFFFCQGTAMKMRKKGLNIIRGELTWNDHIQQLQSYIGSRSNARSSNRSSYCILIS